VTCGCGEDFELPTGTVAEDKSFESVCAVSDVSTPTGYTDDPALPLSFTLQNPFAKRIGCRFQVTVASGSHLSGIVPIAKGSTERVHLDFAGLGLEAGILPVEICAQRMRPEPSYTASQCVTATLALLDPQDADDTGSIGNVVVAASASRADVLRAYDDALPGDTLRIPAGTATWSDSLVVEKDLTIEGAGPASTKLVNTQSASQGLESPIFDIVGASVTVAGIWFQDEDVDSDSDGVRVTALGSTTVIHDCLFEGFSFGLKVQAGFGLAYDVTFLNDDVHVRVRGSNDTSDFDGFADGPPPWGWDSANYFVFEDCTFRREDWREDTYSIDTEFPANYMVRHCLFEEERAANVGLDGVDMHGESHPGRVPLGIVLYDNTWRVTGSSTVNEMKLADVRGGAYSLVFDNVVEGVRAYDVVRDDPTSGVLMTDTHLWGNTGNGSSVPTYGDDGVAAGVNYFTAEPSALELLPYPHPLRP
jgi:hypothetical protein